MFKKIYVKINSKKTYFVLFLLFLTLVSSINVFHSGLIYGDDINFHMHRIMAISDNIRIGKYVPVYFNYLNGFGYGNGLFYPDLFLFIPAFFNFLGLDIILSVKIFVIIINFVSIWIMYLCIYRITNEKKCAYASMVLYSLSLYRLVDFASRGALGEMISFCFLPFVILGLYYLLFDDCRKGYFFTIGLSCLCFSHVISFYLMVFFSVLFVIINVKCLNDKSRLKCLLLYILLAMLVTVHFWLPMIEQLISDSFSVGVNISIFENIVPIHYLLFDLPITFSEGWFPCGIGIVYYISVFAFYRYFKNDRFLFTLVFLSLICVLFCVFGFLWKIDIFYKLFSVVQFPWRFYMFSTLFLIIFFSIIIKNVGFNKFIKLSIVYLGIVFFANVLSYYIDVYIDKPLNDEIMLGEYLPKDFNYSVINEFENNNIDFKRDNNILYVSVKKDIDSIELPLIYYKGYKACSDECFDIYKTDNGLVGISLDRGVKDFKVWYSGTDIYNITKYLSFCGCAILIYKVKKCV